MPPKCLRIGLLGHGAIGSAVARALMESTHGLVSPTRIRLVAVLVRTARDPPPELDSAGAGAGESAAAAAPRRVLFTADPALFHATDFDVCVEAAGQGAVREHAARVLQQGRDFLCTSIGALTDDALLAELTRSASSAGGGQLQLASGAMPALDWMSASSGEPGSQVTAVQTKPPESWIGARFRPGTAELLPDVVDFARLTAPTVFFEGPAREAARQYPKNSNVLAMLALSTAGLDAVRVRLVADPVDRTMRQEIVYEGSAGKLRVDVTGKKSATNPRTSQVVPLAVIKALRNASSPVAFGV